MCKVISGFNEVYKCYGLYLNDASFWSYGFYKNCKQMQIAIRSKRNWFLFLSFAAITDVEASGKPPVMLLTDLSNAEII